MIKLLLCWLLALSFAYADNHHLNSLLKQSLEHNPKIKSQKAKLEAVRKRFEQKSRMRLPDIRADASYGYQRSKTSNLPYDNYPQENYGITLTQDIYTGGRISSDIKKALYEVKQNSAILDQVIHEEAYRFINLYVNIYRNNQQQILANQNISLLDNFVKMVRAKSKQGEATGVEVLQAKADKAKKQAEKVKIKSERKVLSKEYFHITGNIIPDKLYDPSKFCKIYDDKDVLLNSVINNNSKIQQAKAELEMAKQDIEIADSENEPNLSLTVNSSYQEGQNAFYTNRSKTSSAILRLSVPLFDKGISSSKEEEAEWIKNAATYKLQDEKNVITNDFEAAFENYISLKEVISAQEKLKYALENLVKQTKEAFKMGFNTTYDVLEIERDFMKSKQELLDLKMEQNLAACKILQLKGELSYR